MLRQSTHNITIDKKQFNKFFFYIQQDPIKNYICDNLMKNAKKKVSFIKKNEKLKIILQKNYHFKY